jgi:hypothetical protein
MQRDLQVKYFKGMYKELNGVYPHHLKFENIDDDELEKMFNELRDQIDAKKAQDVVDPDVLEKYMSKQPTQNSTMAFVMRGKL